jgi:hypothetical protein
MQDSLDANCSGALAEVNDLAADSIGAQAGQDVIPGCTDVRIAGDEPTHLPQSQ